MQFQKIQDLKEKNLWEKYNNPFQREGILNGSNFGINVYFVGVPNDQRKKKKEYMKLLDLTSSHINFADIKILILLLLSQQSQHNKIHN